MGSISGSGRSFRERNGNPLQYSCPGSSMDSEPGRLKSMGLQRDRYSLQVHSSSSMLNKCYRKISIEERTCEPFACLPPFLSFSGPLCIVGLWYPTDCLSVFIASKILVRSCQWEVLPRDWEMKERESDSLPDFSFWASICSSKKLWTLSILWPFQ